MSTPGGLGSARLTILTLLALGIAGCDGGRKEPGREKLIQHVDGQLRTARELVGRYEFAEAKDVLRELRETLEDSPHADVETYNALVKKIDGAEETLRQQEKDYRAKCRQGWSVFEGRLVSPAEKQRLVEQREKEAAEAPPPERRHIILPFKATTAKITIDGQADDWTDVPRTRCKINKESSFPDYDAREIRFAHDAENLYILLRFKVGIREKFDQEAAARGSVTTGVIGYLRFSTARSDYSFYLPTGFAQTYDQHTGQRTRFEPFVSYDLHRIPPDSDDYETIADRDSDDDPEFVVFDGKYLELKVPLQELGMTGESRFTTWLDEW